MALRLSLRELEVFVAVTEQGTVTAAAGQVALTQSAASQALAALETGLAAPLFDRVGRRLVLNEHGRLLLPRARAMLDAAQDMQRLFDSEAAMHLRLAASTTIANYLLPEQIARFQLQQPQARVELLVANTADVVEAVAGFKVDMGFIEGPCHHPDIVVEPWQDDILVVFAAASHPLAQGAVSLSRLAQAQWVLRESGSGTREEVERLLLPHVGGFAQVMEMGHSEAIKRVVAAGLGVSCLSLHVVQELLDSGQVVAVLAPLPALHRPLYRIHHKDKSQTRGMLAFNRM
ncbi:LysR family transcriptional regulator [Aquitalea magnusonii]|uniref:DNA-binding transcriptional LysR family regulator n=1 Tax=Aquitalea magnusonii TaxID=332411 RepID=A0A318JE40_9NEIS|nr:LysR family transcriptional regulator [Aquitalea magnusonii]PXX46015.1 DNA-binding transcriptional LysR family regulator [Aquitalea magnusonii]